jgi:peptidoglycan/LPS O-acetylase OafA/YrhL
LNRSTSVYLDVLRVIAAFGVFLIHSNLPFFSNNLFLPGALGNSIGHKLVMIFFVLSGFLIAYTVDNKRKSSQHYLIDRFTRLYSVVLPALLLTYFLDTVGQQVNPSFYASQIASGSQGVRFFLNATYLSQVWSLCVKPSSNTPFWSIPYEFWYYMLFWAFSYLGGTIKYVVLIAISLLIGPKILLLLPVWVFGVIAYRRSNDLASKKGYVRLLFWFSLSLIVIFSFFWDFSVFSKAFVFGQPPLFFSSHFVFDWVYGSLVALNLFSFTIISPSLRVPALIYRAIKYLSSITFSLYLFHLPMLIFIAAVVPYDKSNYLHVICLLVGVLLVVILLSEVTEKQRYHLKALFAKVFSVASRHKRSLFGEAKG